MTADNAPEPGPLAAALLQLSELSGRAAATETREAEHWSQVSERLTQLGRSLTKVTTENHMQGEALATVVQELSDLDSRVRIMAGHNHDKEGEIYTPADNVGWHKLSDEERELAVARLRSWAEKVFIPGYGYLARQLPPCWDQHPLCLYVLDWLSELWSLLYLNQKRSAGLLAGQAEFTIRTLPAAVDQMTADAKACGHMRLRAAP